MTDTIFALATAPGKAGLSVVRISGPDALSVLAALGVASVEPRVAHLRKLRDGHGRTLDHALVLTFEEGRSFTGEETVELHLHGSVAVQRAVMNALASTGSCRAATPGEFTRRALMNERMDLTEVQGLADLIDAETEEQRHAALRVFEGELTDMIAGWRSRLIRAMALLEATIDFADEDVPVDVWPEVRLLLQEVAESMRSELDGVGAARSLRSGFEVALIGPPNAGKSSLLNKISRDDVAIVSNIPGTTRDAIRVPVDLGGMKVTFVDTAGLRDSDDHIEQLGIQRTRQIAKNADLTVYLHDETMSAEPPCDTARIDMIRRTKVDRDGAEGISAHTAEGIDNFLEEVRARLSEQAQRAGLISRDRDRDAVAQALRNIEVMIERQSAGAIEYDAECLRGIVHDLMRIVGQIGVEDVLDEVFRTFCLGK